MTKVGQGRAGQGRAGQGGLAQRRTGQADVMLTNITKQITCSIVFTPATCTTPTLQTPSLYVSESATAAEVSQ